MVDRNLLRDFQVSDEDLDAEFGEALHQLEGEGYADQLYDETAQSFDVNHLVKGVVLSIEGDDVLVDIGYKSEGTVHLSEWGEDEIDRNDSSHPL